MFALGDRTSLTDRDLVTYLSSIALIVHEEFLALALVLLVFGVLHIRFDLDGRSVLHSRLDDDTLKDLAVLLDDDSLFGLILFLCCGCHKSD